MKALVLLLTLLSTSAFAGMVTGDKILFQRHSTFVSAVFSKSLCVTDTEFKATIRKCMEWQRDDDDRRCVRYAKVQAVQPIESTRQRCARYDGNDDTCTRWITVPFIQSSVRTVRFYNNDDDLIRIEEVEIPSCN